MTCKRLFYFLAALFYFLVTLTGCAKEEGSGLHSAQDDNGKASLVYRRNDQILCSQNDYYITDLSYLEDGNLLGNVSTNSGNYRLSYRILSTQEELESFLLDIHSKIDSSYRDNIPILKFSSSSMGFYTGFPENIPGGTEIDADLLEGNSLLIIDFLVEETNSLKPRLENLIISDATVTVDILYGYSASTMSEHCGVMYLIPIPKGCDTAKITAQSVPEWCNTSSGLYQAQ